MFDEIAPAYDKLNHLFTLNIDIKWRKEIVKYVLAKNYKSDIVLDLATGTGDLSRELLQLNLSQLFAADISGKMLEIQRKKIKDDRLVLVQSEAQHLPFEDGFFDIVTIGFGVRNFENLEKSLKEIHRVLNVNGKLIVLEMFKAEGLRTKMFNLYFGKIMPFAGNKISGSNAYSYLFNSVTTFCSVKEFENLSEKCGFRTEHIRNNLLSIVNTVYLNKEE